jgi:hypothetical protein
MPSLNKALDRTVDVALPAVYESPLVGRVNACTRKMLCLHVKAALQPWRAMGAKGTRMEAALLPAPDVVLTTEAALACSVERGASGGSASSPLNGEIFAMAGGTPEHVAVLAAIMVPGQQAYGWTMSSL